MLLRGCFVHKLFIWDLSTFLVTSFTTWSQVISVLMYMYYRTSTCTLFALKYEVQSRHTLANTPHLSPHTHPHTHTSHTPHTPSHTHLTHLTHPHTHTSHTLTHTPHTHTSHTSHTLTHTPHTHTSHTPHTHHTHSWHIHP